MRVFPRQHQHSWTNWSALVEHPKYREYDFQTRECESCGLIEKRRP